MARGVPSLLTSTEPRTSAPAKVTIGHIQLRDLLICPHERGIVSYPSNKSIVEHDLIVPQAAPRRITDLLFVPNSLSALILPSSGDTLLAAGGQEAELHLSFYGPTSSYGPSGPYSSREPAHRFGRQRWKTEVSLEGASINNSVLLTSLSLTGSNESSAEPRVVISNNDRTVKFFDVATRSGKHADQRLSRAGQLRLDVPVNHSSISPDGRTLLSVGDSPDVYLHRITGGARVTFSQMMKLSLSPYIAALPMYTYNTYSPYHASNPVPASFSTAFSANGSKFAVASQEGAVVVWDVRSTKPLKVIQTDKERPPPSSSIPTSGATGWLYESSQAWEWGRGHGKAPGWGVRSVKFSPRGVGREVLTFTEHTSLLHVMDAETFETEEIVRVPGFDTPPPSRPVTARPRSDSPATRSSSLSTLDHAQSQPLPSPPRLMLFSGALEETFRIPSSDSTGRRRQRLRDSSYLGEDDGEGIVVIPPLGDREVDDDVRRLFEGRHALSLHSAGDDPEGRRIGGGAEDGMDVDELESDCLSSYNPSRAGSPAPSSSQTQLTSGPSGAGLSRHDPFRRAGLLERRESSSPYVSRRSSSQALARHRRGSVADGSAEVEVEQDLAGTCFDPSGEYIYVAATRGIAEWKVRGAEQRWWTEPSWA